MFDLKNIKVSVFADCFTKEPSRIVNLYDALFNLAEEEIVDEVRRTPDHDKRRKIKTTLPCFTPSGVFDNLYKGATPRICSGLMCVDIDKKENKEFDVETTKQKLSRIEQVGYCGLSVSGNGLFLLIPIAYPEYYRWHYEYFSEMLKNTFGLDCDPSCKNIGRLRVASLDEHPYINLNAKVMTRFKVEPEFTKPPVFQYTTYSSSYDRDSTIDEVDRYINYLYTYRVDITDDYNAWFRIGCALANMFGESGRERFHYISSLSHKYKKRECDIKYSHCLKCHSRISIATFFYYCHQAGVKL